MGFLTVISETGFFHSAVLMEWDGYPGEQYWFGFKPTVNKAPVCSGYIDNSNRKSFVNHYIRFQIGDKLLDYAYDEMLNKYSEAVYAVGVKDCVSLSADVAWWCGLKVTYVNMTPFGLVVFIKLHNKGELAYDTRPLPF